MSLLHASTGRARWIATIVAIVTIASSLLLAAAPAGAANAPKPVVDLSGVTVRPIPAGNGVAQRTATVATATQPLPAGYQETEYLVSGDAALYAGPARGPVTVERRPIRS